MIDAVQEFFAKHWIIEMIAGYTFFFAFVTITFLLGKIIAEWLEGED